MVDESLQVRVVEFNFYLGNLKRDDSVEASPQVKLKGRMALCMSLLVRLTLARYAKGRSIVKGRGGQGLLKRSCRGVRPRLHSDNS